MITVMFGRNRQLQELKITLTTLDVSFMKQAPSVSQVQLFALITLISNFYNKYIFLYTIFILLVILTPRYHKN